MTPPIAAPIVNGDLIDADASHAGPRRVLFLDRDGVINVNHGYVHAPEQTDWLPGIFDLARFARKAGFAIVVVTNQAGIARGYYDVGQFERYTRWMHDQFEREGASLLATYYCPHHPEAGVGDLRIACTCRKPQAGLLLAAARDFCINLEGSVLVGDQPSDIEAASRAGVGARFLAAEGDFAAALDWITAATEG